MAQYPTDEDIDLVFYENTEGEISATDVATFEKTMTAAGRDYSAMTENVPTTFPPSAHNHPISDVTGLQGELDGKAASTDVSVKPFSDTKTYIIKDLVSNDGTIYKCVADNGPGAFDLADWSTITGANGTGISASYDWTSGTSGAVASGFVGITDPVGSATNTIRMSSITALGTNFNAFWDNVEAGDYLMFVENSGDAESVIFQLTGPATSMVGTPDWFEAPVNLIVANGEPENNRAGSLSIIANPNNRIPAGGDTGQVLTKTSGANYDDEWTDLPVRTDYVGGIQLEVVTELPETPLANLLYIVVAP